MTQYEETAPVSRRDPTGSAWFHVIMRLSMSDRPGKWANLADRMQALSPETGFTFTEPVNDGHGRELLAPKMGHCNWPGLSAIAVSGHKAARPFC